MGSHTQYFYEFCPEMVSFKEYLSLGYIEMPKKYELLKQLSLFIKLFNFAVDHKLILDSVQVAIDIKVKPIVSYI